MIFTRACFICLKNFKEISLKVDEIQRKMQATVFCSRFTLSGCLKMISYTIQAYQTQAREEDEQTTSKILYDRNGSWIHHDDDTPVLNTIPNVMSSLKLLERRLTGTRFSLHIPFSICCLQRFYYLKTMQLITEILQLA